MSRLRCFERGRIVDVVRLWIQRLGSYVQTTRKTFVQTIELSSDVLWLGATSFVQTMRGSFVQQIEPSPDALSMEEVVKLFSMAFEQIT